MLSGLNKVVDAQGRLQQAITSYPPLAWAQVTRLMVDVFLLLTPMPFTSEMYVKSAQVQIWPVFASFIVSIIFPGLMAIADIVREPFGDDLDDFNIDAMLMQAEREMFMYLANCEELVLLLKNSKGMIKKIDVDDKNK